MRPGCCDAAAKAKQRRLAATLTAKAPPLVRSGRTQFSFDGLTDCTVRAAAWPKSKELKEEPDERARCKGGQSSVVACCRTAGPCPALGESQGLARPARGVRSRPDGRRPRPSHPVGSALGARARASRRASAIGAGARGPVCPRSPAGGRGVGHLRRGVAGCLQDGRRKAQPARGSATNFYANLRLRSPAARRRTRSAKGAAASAPDLLCCSACRATLIRMRTPMRALSPPRESTGRCSQPTGERSTTGPSPILRTARGGRARPSCRRRSCGSLARKSHSPSRATGRSQSRRATAPAARRRAPASPP